MSFVNNPKYQPYLIALVVLLWVLIAWRMYGYLEPEQNTEAITIHHKMSITEQSEVTWQPDFKGKDPFLKNVKVRASNPQPKTEPKPKKIVDPIPDVQPKLSIQIIYRGFIANDQSEERLGIFQINGQTQLKKQGEYLEQIEVLEIEVDHAVVIENKERFVVDLSTN